ncbi:hypothetical protein Acr_18g0004860 [Actinidia rufa]|uniref:RanBP2-type domain-containing protein n=1 Tax=Actinidia rufa TaxID=165716 RepID=A0A7J0G6A7_9ERIC|nr:hypothetical protein Acr_18g0004860 [Actinidia rufa]
MVLCVLTRNLKSAPTTPNGSCKDCTFLNPYRNTSCEVCGTRASTLSSISILEDDEELDSSVGSVFETRLGLLMIVWKQVIFVGLNLRMRR